MEPTLPFDTPVASAINKARMDHLASLGIPLGSRKVLEVGAGVGKLTGFFEALNCHVVSTEGRKELCEENLRRHPERHNRVMCRDLLVPGQHSNLGMFDIVFCYGTLYHLDKPAQTIEELAGCCQDHLLLETVVSNHDNGEINLVPESGVDQALRGRGCRPGRDWVWGTLKEHFQYVYHTRTQPTHYEFPVEWPNEVGFPRTVFIASHVGLELDTLSDELLGRQGRLQT